MFCTLPLLSEVLSELSALPRELKDKAAADGVEVTLEIFPNEEGTGGREGKGREGKGYPVFFGELLAGRDGE